MFKKWQLIGIIWILVLLGGCAVSPAPTKQTGPQDTWMKTFEGPDYGAFFDILLTEDGNVLAVGASNYLHFPPYSGDFLLMKLTLAGDVLWERTWGGEGYEAAWSVAPASDGGYYVFGETDTYGSGDRDFIVLKITEDGSEDWFETYGGAQREWPYGMLPLANGDLLIYGYTEPEPGSGHDQYALRIASDGGVIWEYVGNSRLDELVIDALETATGDLVLAVAIVGQDGELVKLDPGGRVIWTNRFELEGWQFATQIAPTSDGGFLMAGFSLLTDPSWQADIWLASSTSTGELEWEQTFGDPLNDDYAQSLLQLSDGTYLIGALGNGMPLVLVDEDGAVIWRQTLPQPDVHAANALIELEQGGFLVAGLVQITNGRSYDAVLLRTDADGKVWE